MTNLLSHLTLSIIAATTAAVGWMSVHVFGAQDAPMAYAAHVDTEAASTATVSLGRPQQGAHKVVRSSDGLFYVTARLNGQPVRFAVDTGATAVVLRASDAARIGLNPDKGRAATIGTANGRAAMRWHTVDSFGLGSLALGAMPVAVTRNLDVSLIGQSALRRLRGMTIEGDVLTLH